MCALVTQQVSSAWGSLELECWPGTAHTPLAHFLSVERRLFVALLFLAPCSPLQWLQHLSVGPNKPPQAGEEGLMFQPLHFLVLCFQLLQAGHLSAENCPA